MFDVFYEFGSGLEQRREYIYVEVPAGQGLYVWIDYNDDGIKDLNEFELANFGYEANYLRVFVPSNSYVRSFSNQFSTSALDLRPAVLWANAEGFKTIRSGNSRTWPPSGGQEDGNSELSEALNPFSDDVTDTSLTSYSSSARNTFYYDRTSRKWSVDHTWQNDRSRSLLLNGYRIAFTLVQHLPVAVEHHAAMDLGCGTGAGPGRQRLRPLDRTQPMGSTNKACDHG